jgi:hAT family C-terminal dimerisation region
MDYCKIKLQDYDNYPLGWWKSHASEFPNLARVAKPAICVPESSAPVERIFSTAGKIFRPERTRLSTEKFETLVFIKCNKGLY